MIINPKDQHYSDNYRLLTGIVVPRPIAFVSTLSSDNIRNLAPFSFFMGVASNPPTIALSITVKRPDAEKKDTLKNIEATGEFVVNFVTDTMGEGINETATEFPPDTDEFVVGGFTPVLSTLVKPPRVQESPINMECKTYNIVQVGDGSLGSSYLVIGEIILFHIQDQYLDEKGIPNVQALSPLARLNGSRYSTLGNIFEIDRK